MNFLKALNKEVDTGNNDDFRRPSNGLLKVNTKHPRVVRIIPMPNAPYAFAYRILWVDLHTKDGKKTFPSMLTFPSSNNGDDKLMTLVQNIIRANYQYRNDNPSFKGDVIPLQYKKAGRPNFNASLRKMFALEAIDLVSKNGKYVEKTQPSSKIPLVQIMNVPTSVMSIIQESITTDDIATLNQWINLKTKKPFPLDPQNSMKLRWITNGPTLPVHIHRDNKPSARYQVDPLPFSELPALPDELYAKGSNGKYKYIDDPKWLYEPSKTAAPNIYKMAYNELSKRYDEYKESGHSNPFQDQVKTVKSNVKGSSSDVNNSPVSDSPFNSTKPASSDNSSNSTDTANQEPQVSSTEPQSNKGEQTSTDSQSSTSQTSQAPQSNSTTTSSSNSSDDSASSFKSSVDAQSVGNVGDVNALVDKIVANNKKGDK